MTVLSFKVFGTVLSVPSNTRTRGGRFTGKLEIGKIDLFFDWKIHRWNEQSITQNEPRFNIPFQWRIFRKFWLRPKWRKLVNTNGKNALKSVKVAEFGSQCWILTKMYIRKLAHFYRCLLFCVWDKSALPTIQTSVNFRDFVEQYLCLLWTNYLKTWSVSYF